MSLAKDFRHWLVREAKRRGNQERLGLRALRVAALFLRHLAEGKKRRKKMSTGMHAGNPASAGTPKAILEFLRRRGAKGATGLEIHEECGSLNPGTDVSGLRKFGNIVDCRYEGKTSSGRKVYRYVLLSEDRKGHADSREPAGAPEGARAE